MPVSFALPSCKKAWPVDNLTHTLAGVVSADFVLWAWGRRNVTQAARSSFREAALLCSVLANNAPDVDFAYTGITGGKLGYLLHHRGHTHTLLGMLPLAALAVAIAWLMGRARGQRFSQREMAVLAGLSLLGTLQHVLMDYGNNYGVHPFWPFDNGWYYGDLVFIVDPWLLATLAGAALGALGSVASRALIGLAMAALLALAWGTHFMSPAFATALTLYVVVWLGALYRAGAERRLTCAGAALALILGALVAARSTAREAARAALAVDTELELESLVSTPSPGNPLCWSMLAVQRSRERYVVRQLLASGWPGWYGVEHCSLAGEGSTAPLSESSAPLNTVAGVRWGPEFRGELAELEELLARDCQASAFARFARVPFWVRRGEDITLIGDLRYDRSPAIDFAELPLPRGGPCPRFVPPWERPFNPSRVKTIPDPAP